MRRHAEIATGDAVEVFNGRGCVALKALVNAQVSAGVVAARLDWNKLCRAARNVNALTSETLTDIGGGPTFYSTLVEVRKVSGSDADNETTRRGWNGRHCCLG